VELSGIAAMAARLDPETIQPMRQSLNHVVAKAPWSDELLLDPKKGKLGQSHASILRSSR
jgi:hypothetical protein